MTLHELLTDYKDLDTGIHVCFIDLNKAYDRVNHQALFYRLQESGVDENIL